MLLLLLLKYYSAIFLINLKVRKTMGLWYLILMFDWGNVVVPLLFSSID